MIPRSTLPLPPPVLEEFGELVRNIAETVTNYRLNYRDLAHFDFERLYHTVCIEGHKLDLPADYFLPLASLDRQVAYHNGANHRLTVPLSTGLYTIQRPPSYMTTLHRMMLPWNHIQEMGRLNSVNNLRIPISPVLPPDWYGVPLFGGTVDDTLTLWYKTGVFDRSSFPSLAEAEEAIPNHQPPAFYETVNQGRPAPFVKPRRTHYAYAPAVHFLTAEETEAWFDSLIPGGVYAFHSLDMVNYLSSLGVHPSIISRGFESRSSPSTPAGAAPQAHPIASPGVDTDVVAPPSDRPRSASSRRTSPFVSPPRRSGSRTPQEIFTTHEYIHPSEMPALATDPIPNPAQNAELQAASINLGAVPAPFTPAQVSAMYGTAYVQGQQRDYPILTGVSNLLQSTTL